MTMRGNACEARVLAGETVAGALAIDFFTTGMPPAAGSRSSARSTAGAVWRR